MLACSCDDHVDAIESAVAKNMRRFRKLCQAQDSFAKELLKPSSARKLRDILVRLPNLATVHIDLVDFWKGNSYDFPESESSTPAACFYQSAFPVLLEAVGSSDAVELEISGFGSYCLGGLHPLLINKLGRKRDFLKSIVNIDLVMTHSDDVDGKEYGEPCLQSLRRGDRLSLLLSCAKSLKRLSLSYEDENDWHPANIEGDEQWLEDVFQGQRWAGLKSFTLKEFYTSIKMLMTLFTSIALRSRRSRWRTSKAFQDPTGLYCSIS